MPELPEVESVRRGLIAAKLQAPVRSLWRSEFKLRIGKHWASENLECLRGATPGEVGRRGKYIVWSVRGDDDAALGLVIHLGMSGRCGVAMESQPRVLHTHLALGFADGRELRLVDPRRFGGLRAGALGAVAGRRSGSWGRSRSSPGSRGRARAALGGSARPIRDALLDQSAVAGLGNIYAVEALFLAGIHPQLEARRLQRSAWDRLAGTVVRCCGRGSRTAGRR
jgi:formamidopyrimidine-DNA glycosylase